MVTQGADQGFAAQQERMKTLSKALEKANRAGKPIIISRLPGSASSQDSAGTAYLTGDPALLMALQPRVPSLSSFHCSLPLHDCAGLSYLTPCVCITLAAAGMVNVCICPKI